MSVPLRKTFITREEYLAIEDAAEFKSEYYDGVMYAMSGTTREHNLITLNLVRKIGNQLENRPCELYAIDLRVRVNETGLYTYPDIAITCEEPRFVPNEHDALLNPQVVIEVLSDSTQRRDRIGKFNHFRRVSSLRHYVLVGQKRPGVELYTRQPDDTWLRTDLAWPDGVLNLDAIGVSISLRDIYFKVFRGNVPA